MKQIVPALTLLLFAEAHGQNLVPNWSFEEYTECPSDFSQMDRAIAWESIGGTPDLHNACSITDSVDVPLNYHGNQNAYEGNGYAGILTFHYDSREFLQAQLATPLVMGAMTHVALRVAPGGFGVPGHSFIQLASSGVGLRLSTIQLSPQTSQTQFDYNTALVYMNEILDDTSDWTTLTSQFISDSAYRFVQIGNFFSEANTASVLLDPEGIGEYAYSFIDGVCVSQVNGACDGLAHNSLESLNEFLHRPVLSGGFLSLEVANEFMDMRDLRLFDSLGQCVWSVDPRASKRIRIDMHSMSTGTYLLRVETKTGQVQNLRFVNISQ